MNERVIQLRKSLHLNQTDFAKAIGLTQTALSCIELKKAIVTKRNIIAICSKFNVNEVWLRTGQGDMFIIEDKQFIEFFEIYKKLSPALQDFLFNCAIELFKAQNNL